MDNKQHMYQKINSLPIGDKIEYDVSGEGHSSETSTGKVHCAHRFLKMDVKNLEIHLVLE